MPTGRRVRNIGSSMIEDTLREITAQALALADSFERGVCSGVCVPSSETARSGAEASGPSRRHSGRSMKNAIVGVDVDDVCADLIGEWLRRYNYKYGDNLTREDITSWEISAQTTKAPKGEFHKILLEPDLYEHVLPIPYARTGIYELLANGHRVVYVTHCTPGTEEAKRQWLVKWGFLSPENMRRDFMPIQDKSLARTDFLFDDKVENVETFKGIGVLVDRPHNAFERWKCPVKV